MSESSEKGVSLEKEISKILRKKLGAKVTRDSRSGAGQINKSDISDWYREIPLFIEAKNHKTVKIKEWYRQAEGNASAGQAPTVVFSTDGELLACLRFSELVDFLVEIRDQKAEIADLHKPIISNNNEWHRETTKPKAETRIPPGPGLVMCREGHIADSYGYCQQKGCRFSRGYKLKGVKK